MELMNVGVQWFSTSEETHIPQKILHFWLNQTWMRSFSRLHEFLQPGAISMIIPVGDRGPAGVSTVVERGDLSLPDMGEAGSNWSDHELDLIVADYFSMLSAELRREPYSKAQHRSVLMKQIDRTKGSIEFKHANISAVLHELGLPWVDGYKPRDNFQNAIFGAIGRHLSKHSEFLNFDPPPPDPVEVGEVEFELPPSLRIPNSPKPQALVRLVRKFDPVERDFRNRRLGKAGEEFVFAFERRRLERLDRSDLARKVRWVAQEDGDGAGYDIRSFDVSGAERLIEVKTTCGDAHTPFYLTRNECSLADERPEAFRLYRVFRYSKGARLFELSPPLKEKIHLEALTFQASFR